MPSPTTARTPGVFARRAFSFVVLSALLPGSVQRLAGNRSIGRIATRVFGTALALLVLIGLGLLFFRGPTIGLLLTPVVASSIKVVLWVLFGFWAILLIDSWRLASPIELGRRTRLALTITTLVLTLGVGGFTSLAASGFQAAGNVGGVLQGGGDPEEKAGRYNILLLGVDAAEGRDGIRPDSINVASVHAETGHTVVFGLPRNLQGVRFPLTSPLRSLYRDGYRCEDNACLLNGVHLLGQENAHRYPEGVDAGVEAMKEAIGETLGLELNYHAMVDMSGFQSLINAMGGIELNIGKPIPMGGGSTPIHGYIEPGANVHLDGYHALWFARSRAESSDYERMVRQKCVMSAMAKQLDPMTVATKFVELSEAGGDVLRTDVATADITKLAGLALKAKSQPIESVNFSPPLITPADPDFELIRTTVRDTIEASEARAEAEPEPAPADSPAPAPAPTTTTAPTPEPAPEPTSTPADEEPMPEVPADDEPITPVEELELVCSVP